MFSFFKRKPAEESHPPSPDESTQAQREPVADDSDATVSAGAQAASIAATETRSSPGGSLGEAERQRWQDRLRGGLRKTGTAITTVFTGTRIDDALYEELESALLMADAGVKATQHLLTDLRRRVKEAKASEPARVKALLADAITELLQPLERSLVVGRDKPTVMMVVGVNGAGKTTSIGKLTRYLADHEQKVLLAAADTFRAAAREQLAVWAERSDAGGAARAGKDAAPVEFVSQSGGDPASVSFDAVMAGRARGSDVVIADTAGRLPTQLHLMEELKKIRRVIAKAQVGAPHEVLLVIDGNTGQNALEPGQGLRRGARPDRAHRDQARRHGQGWRARRHRAVGARACLGQGRRRRAAGLLHRRGRAARGSADLQGARVRDRAAGVS